LLQLPDWVLELGAAVPSVHPGRRSQSSYAPLIVPQAAAASWRPAKAVQLPFCLLCACACTCTGGMAATQPPRWSWTPRRSPVAWTITQGPRTLGRTSGTWTCAAGWWVQCWRGLEDGWRTGEGSWKGLESCGQWWQWRKGLEGAGRGWMVVNSHGGRCSGCKTVVHKQGGQWYL